MKRTERIQASTNSAGAAPRQSGSGSARIVVHAARGAAIGTVVRGTQLPCNGWAVLSTYQSIFEARSRQGLLLRAHRDHRVDARSTQRGNPACYKPDPGHREHRRDDRDGIVRRYPEQHPANDPAGENGAGHA